MRGALRKLVISKVFTQQETQKAHDLAGAIFGMLTAAIITLENKLDENNTA